MKQIFTNKIHHHQIQPPDLRVLNKHYGQGLAIVIRHYCT